MAKARLAQPRPPRRLERQRIDRRLHSTLFAHPSHPALAHARAHTLKRRHPPPPRSPPITAQSPRRILIRTRLESGAVVKREKAAKNLQRNPRPATPGSHFALIAGQRRTVGALRRSHPKRSIAHLARP